MNEERMELQFKNSVTGQTKLENYLKTLNALKLSIESLPNQINISSTDFSSDIKSINSSLKTFTNNLKSNTSEVKKTENATKKLTAEQKKWADIQKKLNAYLSVENLRNFSYAVRELTAMITQFVQSSASYTENLNLLNVAFDDGSEAIGNATDEAQKFVNTMSEIYNLDESRLTRSLGVFKQLTNAMGITEDVGSQVSETLVKMTNDISSLYNVSLERAENALSSALVGQVRPIRGVAGADITENTLQTTLETIGLDAYIRDMSFAEKRMLMIISLNDQLVRSQGDWARTIESTANQMKIFEEQTGRLSRAFGNVFIPIITAVLPILNAIMMVMTELLNIFARLLGFQQQEFDTGLSGVSDEANDLIDGMTGAGSAVDDLQDKLTGLRGFDKLNVITTPTDTSASGGSGVGDIDPAIMDALLESMDSYNDMMDKVETKATRIRNAIMEWLGFTKEIDEVTGDVSFKFEKLTSGTVMGAFIVGGSIYSGIRAISLFLAKIGLVSKGLPSLFGLVKGAIVGLGKALTAVVVAIAGFFSIPVAAVVAIGAAIAGAIALIWVFRDEIWLFLSEVGTWFMDVIINPVINFFSTIAQFIWDNAIQPIISFFTPIAEALGEIFSLIFKNITDIVVGVGTALYSILAKIGEIIVKVVEIFIALGSAFGEYVIKPIIDFVVSIAQTIYEKAIQPILDVFAKVGEWVYNKIIVPIVEKVTWLKDKVVSIFKTIGTTVVNFVSDSIKSVINGILWGIEKTINGFIKMLNSAIKTINKIPGVDITKVKELDIPRLKTGMDFVPKDFYGPVYLDYGERVLTKEENERYNKQGPLATTTINNNTNSQPTTFIIQVGSREVAREVLSEFNNMAKSNGKPIKIGG